VSIILALWLATAAVAPQAPASAPPAASCTEWRDCRTQTLEAIARGELELAHDLAWRTVQRGPQGDPDLMLLLARAQSLFGRPQDALVMLRRLADRGVKLDLGADPDFDRTRAMTGWPDLEAAFARASAGPAAPSAPSPPTSTPSSTAKATEGASTAPSSMEEAIRFSAEPFVPGGIAYDGVSRRFVFGDRDGRKLRVVGEGLGRATDLVGASSGGFFSVHAIEIDRKRGDLWVATSDSATGDGAIHKLQLISGRLLTIIPAPSNLTPMAVVDLAVTQSGGVLAIDRARSRVVRVRPGVSRLETLLQLQVEQASSLAVGSSEGVAYVAHREGISRVDVSARRSAPLTGTPDIALDGFERIRWHAGALVGIRAEPGGRRRLVRLDLSPNGRRVRKATVYDAEIPGAGAPPSITVVGDDLCFIGSEPASGSTGAVDRVVHRVNLKVR
jgi:hypothetical protein